MDYLYENLGDERFQEFCGCLVSKEFPNVQVFPVGQPDGGRDLLVYSMDKSKKEFIVFQVKFVRNANQDRDIHKWLTEIIEGEIKKISGLIPKGAKGYYLLTNVRGTAHLDVGSKDKLNRILEENIKIPSMCWWREDLSVIFEKDPIFKWSYPEILNGQDILNSLMFNNLNENKERRENVIRAYLADQYEMDNEVKFRQIELQNRMFNLFTDVPFRIKKFDEKNKQLKRVLNIIGSNIYRRPLMSEDYFSDEECYKIGIAEFLLHPKVQDKIGKVLLEGGPGQGKSTISQYVSQVHRARLLNKISDLNLLPDNIKDTTVRLPFKIDLRHIAAWVEHKNPYEGIVSEDYFNRIWQKSLESFLVAHIYFHSKIEGFNSSDFLSIFKVSPVLFVFDGFDEIANRKSREEVIEFINKGINRISENCKSVQVIITSRPAAFSDFIGFSASTYPHFQLTDINSKTIREYVEKWIKASRLEAREASEIRKLVEEKLKMPHLRELTKSPMQLAIFISLLRTRGESLPNKRTALYESYIDLFFNRESEKNSTIRDYRDLIIDIHEYLAWVLHSEAELYKNSGTIGIEELKRKLNEYLIKEGHKTDITDKLFQVVKERVCALVSRVQGTFEFEVQPLREYFCAKYLYKTSPYSPVGAEKPGTLPDRFEAISRNFYWQNVTRFFAGCFSKGELAMLIQKLKELEDDDELKYTNYPRIVTSQLLSDYVFTQYPLLLKDVVKIIVNGINIRSIINKEKIGLNNESITLPTECGRKELVIECFKQLKTFPNKDYALELIDLIKTNPYEIVENWSEFVHEVNGEQLTLWLEYGYRLGIIHQVDENTLVDIINRDDYVQAEKRIIIVINGNRLDVIEKHLDFKELALKGILSNRVLIVQRNRVFSALHFLGMITSPSILSVMSELSNSNISFIDYISRYFSRHLLEEIREQIQSMTSDETIDVMIDKKIHEFLKSTQYILSTNILNWNNSIEPWDFLVENGRRIFGDSWRFDVISVISAGIKSKKETYEEFYDLSDSSISLCKRARCARLKSGNAKYWEKQISSNKNLQYKLLVFFTWATPNTIVKVFNTLSPVIDSLKRHEILQLAEAIEVSSSNNIFSKSQQNKIINEINQFPISDSFKFLLSMRFGYRDRQKFVSENINDNFEAIEEIIELKLEFLIEKYLLSPSNESILNQIRDIYQKVKSCDGEREQYLRFNYRSVSSIEIPLQIAKRVMSHCKEYPRIIAFFAEKSCKINAYEYAKPVGEIAKEEKWFE